MFSHVLKTPLPFADVEVGVAEPSVPIVGRAAPFPFGHVIVEVYIYLLLRKFGSDSVVNLSKTSIDCRRFNAQIHEPEA